MCAVITGRHLINSPAKLSLWHDEKNRSADHRTASSGRRDGRGGSVISGAMIALSFAKISSDSKIPRLDPMAPSSTTLHPMFQVAETKGERVLAKDRAKGLSN